MPLQLLEEQLEQELAHRHLNLRHLKGCTSFLAEEGGFQTLRPPLVVVEAAEEEVRKLHCCLVQLQQQQALLQLRPRHRNWHILEILRSLQRSLRVRLWMIQ